MPRHDDDILISFGPLWRVQVAVGVLLILLGLLIAVFPEILVAAVAGAIILTGVVTISNGLRLRRLTERQ